MENARGMAATEMMGVRPRREAEEERRREPPPVPPASRLPAPVGLTGADVLLAKVRAYNPHANLARLRRAWHFAQSAHAGQKRASGEPYFIHPVSVACILADLRLDEDTIIAALLHDVVEDTPVSLDEIQAQFGEGVAMLVEGLTKIRRLDLVSKEALQAENLRKFLLAVSRDVRVLLVKLADRLHNMRTLKHVPEHKRRRIAQETMDIYAPLAMRMGLQGIREELEDLAFVELNPRAYAQILGRLRELKRERADVVEYIRGEIARVLRAHGITDAEVTGREKRPYSIWRKMEQKKLELSKVTDILGFRVIVETVDECYQALGAIHRTWPIVMGRFKDYISVPKINGYQSIHTTVRGPTGAEMELQIRTWLMHEVAEYGVAAHGLYKEARTREESERGYVPPREVEETFQWLRAIVEDLESGRTPKDILEHTRLELFTDQVFCFTPEGDVIVLPRGATAIDFAYAVHTDIGHSAVGCRINGKHASLLTRLNNGDEVRIITSQAQKVPPAAWEKVVATAKARAAIRRATREALRAEYIGLGEEMLEHWLKRLGQKYSRGRVAKVFPKLGIASVDDGLEALGRGDMQVQQVLEALGLKAEEGSAEAPLPGRRGTDFEGRLAVRDAIRVRRAPGSRHLPIVISTRTGAVPGERIVGIAEHGVITIFPIFARELERYEDVSDRKWVDVDWNAAALGGALFPARVRVVVHNEVGALARVAGIIGEHGANIENLVMTHRATDLYDFDIMVEVRNVEHLNDILFALRESSVVVEAERHVG